MLRARKGQRQMTLREDSGHLLLEAKRGIDFCPNWQLRSRPWYLQSIQVNSGAREAAQDCLQSNNL